MIILCCISLCAFYSFQTFFPPSMILRLNLENTGPCSKHWPGLSHSALISLWSTNLHCNQQQIVWPKKKKKEKREEVANVHFVQLISEGLCTNSRGVLELLWLPPASSEPLSAVLCTQAKKCAGIGGGLMGQFLTNPDGCLRRNWSKLTVSDNYRLLLK